VNALKQNLGNDTSRQDAQVFLNAYFQTFLRLAEYLEDTKTLARKQGYTETLFGRRRHFPGITSSVPFIRASAERMAINAPIQGTAADIVRVAMVKIWEHIKTNKISDSVRMLLQIHDELVFEIKNEELSKQIPVLKAIMESPVEVKIGQNWRDMEKLK
jgi:DNA polymerase I